MHTICITGSRNWKSKVIIENTIANYIESESLSYSDPNEIEYRIIHGDADGADTLADKAARLFNLEVIPVPAEWDKYHKRAGMIRNRKMLDDYKPDILLAFPRPDSIGTIGCINEAIKRQIPIVIRYEPA